MKTVLLDNCVPRRLVRHLPFSEVVHTSELGWSDLLNGHLVRTAQDRFDVLVTVDQNMRHQTSLKDVNLGVVVVEVTKNSLEEILLLLDPIIEAVSQVGTGEF